MVFAFTTFAIVIFMHHYTLRLNHTTKKVYNRLITERFALLLAVSLALLKSFSSALLKSSKSDRSGVVNIESGFIYTCDLIPIA